LAARRTIGRRKTSFRMDCVRVSESQEELYVD
jgi:hypothetical protein